MLYPASLIAADEAYHCPVGSTMAILLIGWTSIPKADDDDGYGDVDDDDIPASPLLRATPQESNSR